MNAYLDLKDFAALSPLLILLGGAMVLLLWETFAGKRLRNMPMS